MTSPAPKPLAVPVGEMPPAVADYIARNTATLLVGPVRDRVAACERLRAIARAVQASLHAHNERNRAAADALEAKRLANPSAGAA